MKKIKLLLASLGLLFGLTSCNKQIFDFKYTFNKVHIISEHKCYEIKKWKDYEGEQLQVIFYDGSVVLLSSVNAMLVNGNCPICDK